MSPGALRPSDRGRRPVRISLTPLIDVVFILLVFFMLATRFDEGRALPLTAGGEAGQGEAGQGEAGQGEAGPQMTGAVLIEVTPAGLRLGGAPVAPGGLADALARHAGRPVLLTPRGAVSTARLVAALDRIEAAGVARVTLMGKGG